MILNKTCGDLNPIFSRISMTPVIAAFRVMRSVGLITATTVVAEADDIRASAPIRAFLRSRAVRALEPGYAQARRDHQSG